MMRATSLGHAGILIEAEHGSIVCDPWFVPAFFGSWFPFPRNDQLDDDLRGRIEGADYLYVSHLHGDHWDEPWLRDHLPRDIGVLLPGYPTRELDRKMRALGFTNLIRTVDGEELDLGGLTVAIHVETSITDGPGGDSALVVSDGDGAHRRPERLPHDRPRRAARPRSRRPALAAVQRGDLVPDGLRAARRRAAAARRAKVDSQLARAMRYVEAVGARAVVPSAGPPCFLDPELFHLNVIDGDEPSIFCDQRTFLDRLARSGHRGVLAVPGTTIEVTPGDLDVRHPFADAEVDAIFTDKGAYLRRYQARLDAVARRPQGAWPHDADTDLARHAARVVGAAAGDGPDRAGRHRGGVPAADRRRRRRPRRLPRRRGQAVRRRGSTASGSTSTGRSSRRSSPQRAVDWSNSLFLSCRFRAWRDGEFNEWVYNFFKSLSVERMRRTEAEAVRRLDPPTETEPDIELDGWIVQRRCPHRNADLAVFGEIDGLHADLHAARLALRPRRPAAASRPPTTRSRSAAPTRSRSGRDPSRFPRRFPP